MTTFDPSIGRNTRWKRGQPSPNPGGRPRSRALSEALRNKLGEVKEDDPQRRTHAELIALNMIRIASSENRGAVAAASEIADRVEGRALQSIEIADVAAEIRARSDEELRFYLANSRWPAEGELVSTAEESTQ